MVFGKKIFGKFVRLLTLFFVPLLLNAQPEGVALRHLTTDDGLPHNSVSSIAKDTQGFMWFGTADGLARYDGKRFTVFRHHKGASHSITSNSVMGMTVDPLGRMWVSTEKGLCYWDYANRYFQQVPVIPPGHKQTVGLYPFVFDKTEYGWSTGDTFLIRLNYRTLQLTFYPLPYHLSGISFLYVDSKGRIWVNVVGNVFQFHPENQSFEFKFGRKHPDPKKNIFAGCFAEDEQERVWCSSWGNGLFVLNEQTGEFDDYDDGPAISTVLLFARHPDAGPIVWVGGGIYGLYWLTLRDRKSIEFPPLHKEPFSHNNTAINSIYKDPETNIVWLATLAGVEKYDPNDLKFTRVTLPDSIVSNQFNGITGIVRDPRTAGKYWITIWGKGLVEWNRREKKFRHYSEAKNIGGLYSDEVFDIICDKKGKIWLAEFQCVQEFDPVTKRFRTFKPRFPTPGVNHKILQMIEGRDGRIWFGTNYEGLYWLDPDSGHIGHVPLDGKKHYIQGLAQDKQGRLLIGFADGFFRYDPLAGTYEHFLPKGNIQYSCNDFAFDRQNRLWVACNNGLLRLDDTGRIDFSLTTSIGLPNDMVYNIEIDMEDRFWLATGNGLVRYYPHTGVMNVFRRSDGLFENDINEAFRMLPHGELFIGFADAFNLANTSRLPMNPTPPRVALTDVLILNKFVPWRLGDSIVLKPGDNVVSFDFATLNFTQPEKTVLSYKLEGFQKDWVETQQNRITYTNLDGGDYTLLVRARNGDGIWSNETLQVSLKVIPPFTKTVWFRLILLAVLGSIITLVFWYRRAQQLRLEAIRRRIARDLHDDMGSTVSSIRFFSEVAQSQLSDKQTPTKDLLSRISQSAATLSESIQDIVWAINARHDNFEELAARMREFGLKVSEARGIRFSANIPSAFPQSHLRPDHRRNIYLIFKEAVNNAAKYSGCSEISVAMQVNRRKLFLEIEDNGKGFDPAMVQYGNGIANMRQRAEEIKGKLAVETAPGEGVKILLEVGV